MGPYIYHLEYKASPQYRSSALAKLLVPPEPYISKPSTRTKSSARVLTSHVNLKILEDKEQKKWNWKKTGEKELRSGQKEEK